MNTQPGPPCPHCQSERTYRLNGIPGRWCRCSKCGRVFQRPPVTYVGLSDVDDDIEALRRAGLDAWDAIEDPEEFVKELRHR